MAEKNDDQGAGKTDNKLSIIPGRRPKRRDYRAIVDQWWHDKIHNSPLARHTPSYNHLQTAIDDLVGRLEQEE